MISQPSFHDSQPQAHQLVERVAHICIGLLLTATMIGMLLVSRLSQGFGLIMADLYLLSSLGFSAALTGWIARMMRLPSSLSAWILLGSGAAGIATVVLAQITTGKLNRGALIYSTMIIVITPFQIVFRSLLKAAKSKEVERLRREATR